MFLTLHRTKGGIQDKQVPCSQAAFHPPPQSPREFFHLRPSVEAPPQPTILLVRHPPQQPRRGSAPETKPLAGWVGWTPTPHPCCVDRARDCALRKAEPREGRSLHLGRPGHPGTGKTSSRVWSCPATATAAGLSPLTNRDVYPMCLPSCPIWSIHLLFCILLTASNGESWI